MAFKSLRAQLLFWLLVPLALVVALDAWVTYHSARETATIIQERMLLGAARMIGAQVRLEEGVVQVVVPPTALELFASPSRDRVYYRITEKDGELLSGYYDLALPPPPPGAPVLPEPNATPPPAGTHFTELVMIATRDGVLLRLASRVA